MLRRAVDFIGFPYVWGGMSENTQTLFGVTSRGGFDCSGFVWRVYKTKPYADAPRLGTTIHGRTTYDMSGEIPRCEAGRRANLAPADIIFFGDRGPGRAPARWARRHLDGWRLVHPLVRAGRHDDAAHGLVLRLLRLGPAPAPGSRPQLA